MRVTLTALVVLVCLAALPAGAGAAERPNVIVIQTDDQTAASVAYMPIVQRLIGDRGLTFENSFASFPLCCPSRATFLTGQYAHNHGVFDNVAPFGGYARLRGRYTLPVWLRDAGYRTIHIGKYLNGYGSRRPTHIPRGWTDWHGLVGNYTYQYFGYKINENGRVRQYKAKPSNYQTDVLSRKAIRLARSSARGRRPFFMYLAYVAPHFSFTGVPEPDDPRGIMRTPDPAPRDRDRFAGTSLPVTPAYSEPDVSDKPAAIRRKRRIGPRLQGAIQENYQQSLESLQAVDRGIGRLVRALDRAGELDRTLILFTSDNGYFFGEHRLPREKILPYDPALRVPLLMRGPGVPRGLRLQQLVSNQDLASTVLDAANVPPVLEQDGMSLLEFARHPRTEPGRDLLFEGLYRSGPHVTFATLRTRRWHYTEYSSGERELYDMVADPNQLVNRDLNPRYAGIEANLAHRLERLAACYGRRCRTHPRIRLTVRGELGRDFAGRLCARSDVTVLVRGADSPRVRSVDLYANDALIESDASGRRSFVIPRVSLPSGQIEVRPNVYLTQDRAYTPHVSFRTCGPPGPPRLPILRAPR